MHLETEGDVEELVLAVARAVQGSVGFSAGELPAVAAVGARISRAVRQPSGLWIR